MEYYSLILATIFIFTSFVSSFPLGRGSGSLFIPKIQTKNYSYEDYKAYLKSLLRANTVPQNLQLNFPETLRAPDYTLSQGKVEWSDQSLNHYGWFKGVRFYEDSSELFGVIQVYAPKVNFSFRLDTKGYTGKVILVVTHEPMQVQMDLGNVKGQTCTIDRSLQKQFFFLDQPTVTVTVEPDSPSGLQPLEALAGRIGPDWISDIYRMIVEIKSVKLAKDVKTMLIEGKEENSQVKEICKAVQ